MGRESSDKTLAVHILLFSHGVSNLRALKFRLRPLLIFSSFDSARHTLDKVAIFTSE